MGRPRKVQSNDTVQKPEDKDLGESIENFEQEVENLKNTKIKLFGFSMTPTTIGALLAIVTTVIGSLYGAFQVYTDYMGMKNVIENINVEAIQAENEKVVLKLNEALLRIEQGTEYTRDIKQGLRDDLMHTEKQVERMEEVLRKSETDVRKIVQHAEERFENKRDALQNDYDKKASQLRDTTDQKIKDLENRLNSKLQQALDNPLAR